MWNKLLGWVGCITPSAHYAAVDDLKDAHILNVQEMLNRHKKELIHWAGLVEATEQDGIIKIRALTRAKERHSGVLSDIKNQTGISMKFGGAVDVDYDKLCDGLGLEQCIELRSTINTHLKKWRAQGKVL